MTCRKVILSMIFTADMNDNTLLMKRILMTILVVAFSIPVSAQAVSEKWVTSDTLQVFFRQGESDLDSVFRDNGTSQKEFSERFHTLMARPRSKVRSVLIVSGASPEGHQMLNRRLSDSRARAVYDYLLSHRLLEPSEIEVESRGVDWKGLAVQMEQSDKEYKDAVLECLNRSEDKVASLMALNDGAVWKDIYDTYFPDLRGTMVMISWSIKRDSHNLSHVQTAVPVMTFDAPSQEALTHNRVFGENPNEKWQLRMAVKTNLLYDGMLIPNLGVELGLWKGLTLNVEYMHNVWLNTNERKYDKKHFYRVHGAEFGLKYYINKENRPFARGHHVGLSGLMLTFDVTGILADADPWKGGMMATYGYNLPITSRLNLDFEAGLGFIAGDIHKYDVVENGPDTWLRIHKSTDKAAFVPKLGVTLQYLIGTNNYNTRRK